MSLNKLLNLLIQLAIVAIAITETSNAGFFSQNNNDLTTVPSNQPNGAIDSTITLPIILFNNDDNAIHYDFISDDTTTTTTTTTNQSVIITEKAAKLYSTDYKIKCLDIDVSDKYMVWSSASYPYPIFLAEYRSKADPRDSRRTRLQIYKRSLVVTRKTYYDRSDVAIDWVHDLVYYFNNSALSVVDIRVPEVSYELTAVGTADDDRLTSYRSFKTGNIAVNPYDAFIVWSEYRVSDGMGVIRRCQQDGSGQQILVQQNVLLPICLVIDFRNKRIVWIDNDLHSLSSVDYSGANRRTLRVSKQYFSDCQSMDIHNGSLYWTSPKHNNVFRYDLDDNSTTTSSGNIRKIVESDLDIDFVRIISSDKQSTQPATNYCQAANCSHLCLPNGPSSYRCVCSDSPNQLDTCTEPNQQKFQLPKLAEPKQNTSAIAELTNTDDPLILFVSSSRDIRLGRLLSTNIGTNGGGGDNNPMHFMSSEFVHKINHSVSALEYSVSGNFIVWFKMFSFYESKTTMFGAPFVDNRDNDLQHQPGVNYMVNITGSSPPRTMALDWIHNLLYFPMCSTSLLYVNKGVYVMNLTAQSPTIYQVVPHDQCVTKDVRVDPVQGYLFWTELHESVPTTSRTGGGYSRLTSSYRSYGGSTYGSTTYKSQIWRSLQDGENKTLLHETPLVRRNTLTLDLAEQRLYWIDMQSVLTTVNTLYSIRYDGTDLKAIHTFQRQFKDSVVSAMDVFGNHVYWTENTNDTIMRIPKRKTGAESVTLTESQTPEPELVLQSSVDIDSFKIIHQSRRPSGQNKCAQHNCHNICLPMPTGADNRFHSCFCMQNEVWNGHQCVYSATTGTGGGGGQTTSMSTSVIGGGGGGSATGITAGRTPSTSSRSFEVLNPNKTRLLFVVYKEGVYVKPEINELNTNYMDSLDLYPDTDWITEVDYNYRDNYMLWLESNIFDGFKLNAAPIDKNKTSRYGPGVTLLLMRTFNAKRLSYDWIHNLVYMAIDSNKCIDVFTLAPNWYSYTVVSHDSTQGDVAVDPVNGVLVWSQWKYLSLSNQHTGQIMRANQDGSDQRTLFQSAKIPNTLALDMDSQLIYWIDTSQYSLSRISYTGSGHTVILTSQALFDGAFSMDVFDDYVFWSNYEKNNILVTHISGANGTEPLPLVTAYTDLEGLRVLDSSRQPNATDRCAQHNCSQICLPAAGADSYRCVCSKSQLPFTSRCAEQTTEQSTTTTTTMTSLITTEPTVDGSLRGDDSNEYMTTITTTPTTTTSAPVDYVRPVASHVIANEEDPIHSHIKNLTNRLDSLVQGVDSARGTTLTWVSVAVVSVVVNVLIIISLYIYYKRKNQLSTQMRAQFSNDREEVYLNQGHSTDNIVIEEERD
ncbi:low-density lipoprotein receptor-related protein 1-like isoform X2 [Oppia nitens]|uniref:low-density lipoprotein receptor-related protein 1-like isoform X2 n=1 Tax=Oppia nitens TaxID=1686743 RepID=UPI0023DA699E|nr:low-density lipoprotein receptor-related protein 1-like isoform X2 [Oppia nitens]